MPANPLAPPDPGRLLSVPAVPGERPGRVVVQVTGEVGTFTGPLLQLCLDSQTEQHGLRELVVDLEQVTFPGAHGVARSYEEAREALLVADRLGLDSDVVHARDLLIYRVLGRDQAAIVDVVRDVLGPLLHSRSGAEVLLETLHEYFDAGDVATEAARRLHVSVRTVTDRLARVAHLTGYSVSRPDQRFSLHAAVLGARLLEWPSKPLPVDP